MRIAVGWSGRRRSGSHLERSPGTASHAADHRPVGAQLANVRGSPNQAADAVSKCVSSLTPSPA